MTPDLTPTQLWLLRQCSRGNVTWAAKEDPATSADLRHLVNLGLIQWIPGTGKFRHTREGERVLALAHIQNSEPAK